MIGSGYNNGQPQAFLPTLVPEPAAAVVLLALALTDLRRSVNRQRFDQHNADECARE